MEGIADLKHNINVIYNVRKAAAVYALCTYYAAMALQYFRAQQATQQYWNNQTHLAMDTVFSRAFREGNEAMGWFMAHTQQYGVKLELGNDRRNEAIRPIIERYYSRFRSDLEKIYGDN